MKQFEIIKTEDYILAVSTEKVVEGEYGVGYAHGIRGKGEGYFIFKHDGTNKSKLNSICADTYKVIAHLPLNNSPILEGVMLLPEIVVDIEQLAENYKNKKGTIPTTELEDEIFKLGFKDGYKTATKTYSEKDLLNLTKFITSKYRINPWINNPIGEDEFKNHDSETITNLFIQSLKQPTPKYFIAEIETYNDCINHQGQHLNPNCPNCCYSYKLKTTTINGKQLLVGTYKFE